MEDEPYLNTYDLQAFADDEEFLALGETHAVENAADDFGGFGQLNSQGRSNEQSSDFNMADEGRLQGQLPRTQPLGARYLAAASQPLSHPGMARSMPGVRHAAPGQMRLNYSPAQRKQLVRRPQRLTPSQSHTGTTAQNPVDVIKRNLQAIQQGPNLVQLRAELRAMREDFRKLMEDFEKFQQDFQKYKEMVHGVIKVTKAHDETVNEVAVLVKEHVAYLGGDEPVDQP